MKNLITSQTTTIPNWNEYSSDYIENELIRFVRYAKTDKDALNNIKIILKEYDKRKSFIDIIKMLLNK